VGKEPNARGLVFSMMGILILMGLALIIGLLMSAVASTQTIKDPKEGDGPLDIREASLDHSDERLYFELVTTKRFDMRDLSRGARVFLTLDTGDGIEHVLTLVSGPKGRAMASLGSCTADGCEWTDAGRGRKTGARSLQITVPRKAIPGLSDRVEWWAGAVNASGVSDFAPDSGAVMHHF
jgi:hypothetical protein